MSAQKITASERKLSTYAEAREVDRIALALKAKGVEHTAAYRQAFAEVDKQRACLRR
jgi:hypothetical protein